MRELAILVALVLSACAGEMSESEGGSGSAAGETSVAGAAPVDASASGGSAVGLGGSSQVPGVGGAVSLGGTPSGVGGAASGGSGEGGAQGVGGAPLVRVDCDNPDPGASFPTCLSMDGISTCTPEGCERCPTGFLDCDGAPANGCEVPVSDSQCEGCTFACADGYSCDLKVLSGRDEPVEVGFRCK